LGGQGTIKFKVEFDPFLPERVRQKMFDVQARLLHPFLAEIGSRGLQELENGHWEVPVSVSVSVEESDEW
jgi:hypothetical protein